MKRLPSLLTPPRTGWLVTTFFAVLLGGWLVTPASFSQAPNAVTSNTILSPFLVKIKAQQDQLAANQTKIEAQTTLLKEELRLSKIYAARSGAKH